MASSIIEVPSFDYSAFYYPQILEALLVRKRIDVPELTDESEFEPFIQLLRSFAIVGHLNNTLLDVVANENTLPTASLVETVRNMLKLIDYDLASASPSSTDLVYELSKVFSAATEVVPALSQASTRAGTVDAIFFEALTGITVSRTDRFGSVAVIEGGFSDFTGLANLGFSWSPWVTPISGLSLYFGHDTVMWTATRIAVSSPAINIVGIWEFYEGDLFDVAPTSVTNLGGGVLQFDLTTLLGASDRRGTIVQIALNESGATRTVTSTWTGSANIGTTDLIGQTSPSTTASDYTIGTAWTEFAQDASLSFVDGTSGLTTSGDVTFALPQSELRNWKKTTVENIEAFWIRFRIISVSTPTSPTLGLCRMDTGKQYAITAVTQGRSVSDDPLGSSTGSASQSFETTRDHFIDNSEVFSVDGEAWTRVDNFLASGSQDKHYTVTLGENDRATINTGDGVQGRIPPVGQGNVSIDYRFNAELDGNVGANTIVVDKTGLTFVNSLFNPRQATGWSEAEGSTDASLAKAKIAGPASLRAKSVALNGDDAETLAVAFTASDGTKPFSRATAIEEGFGPKTVALILVGKGGGIPSTDQLEEIDLYFNGDKFASPPVPKHYVANQEVTAVAYSPRVVDVTGTVTAREGITLAQIVNGLAGFLQPEALRADGVTYEWDFGGTVPISRISKEIFKVDESLVDKVDLVGSDIALTARELPVLGTVSLTIVSA